MPSTPETLTCSRCGTTEKQAEVRKNVFSNPSGWSEIMVKRVRIRTFQLCGACTPGMMIYLGSKNASR